jgi:heme A synthase
MRWRASLLLPYAGTAAFFLPFLGDWRAIRDNVVFYRSVPRSYGLSEFVLFDSRFAFPVAILCLAVGALVAWRLRTDPDLLRASLVLFLVLLVLAPGFGTQYMIWPLTLGALVAGTGYFLCTFSTMAWALGSHFGVPGSGRWMGHLVWLSILFWLARETRAARRSVSDST